LREIPNSRHTHRSCPPGPADGPQSADVLPSPNTFSTASTEILRKRDPLTFEEWTVLSRHPVIAYELLSPIEFLADAIVIPFCHHEHWDGTGYPRGLSREEIPLPARIFAVVDVWDAVQSDRPYKAGWSRSEAVEHLRTESGRLFDPHIVEVFLGMIEAEQAGDSA
jgi:HD-GYP domain-containing protein (c-di-GMP phosphodiesterase class II)